MPPPPSPGASSAARFDPWAARSEGSPLRAGGESVTLTDRASLRLSRLRRFRWFLIAAMCVSLFSMVGSTTFLLAFGWSLQVLWPEMFYVSVVLTAFLVVGGLLAGFALLHRPGTASVGVTIGALLLASCLCLTLIVVTLVSASDPQRKQLGEFWSRAAERHPERLCAIERELECTGWLTQCPADAKEASDDCPLCTPPVVGADTCHHEVVSIVGHYTALVSVSATFGMIGLVAVAALLYRVTRPEDAYLPDESFT
jgi:hypothetical protein